MINFTKLKYRNRENKCKPLVTTLLRNDKSMHLKNFISLAQLNYLHSTNQNVRQIEILISDLKKKRPDKVFKYSDMIRIIYE